MLETVREFVAERLAARPDAGQVGRRHADYYRGLAEQADRPLRGAGQGEWLERLDAEAGNPSPSTPLSRGSAAGLRGR
jgi:predicted ATPase